MHLIKKKLIIKLNTKSKMLINFVSFFARLFFLIDAIEKNISRKKLNIFFPPNNFGRLSFHHLNNEQRKGFGVDKPDTVADE